MIEQEFAKDGHEIRIIVTHFKSLFINQGDQMWSSPDPEQRILISPSLNPYMNSCKVEYEKYDALVDDPDRRDGRPIDHRPVTLSLGLN